MVEKKNFDGAGVVFVNHPRANIDHMFSSEGRSGCNAAVCARGDCERDTNINKGLAMGGNGLIFQSGEIVAGG